MGKPTFKRALRVADRIRVELADIIRRKTKDPRIHQLIITDVQVASDLRYAKIFFTTLPGGPEDADMLVGLSSATGFIRGELGRRLELRYVPELIFQRDIIGQQGERLLSLLEELKPAGSEVVEPPLDVPNSSQL